MRVVLIFSPNSEGNEVNKHISLNVQLFLYARVEKTGLSLEKHKDYKEARIKEVKKPKKGHLWTEACVDV